jgi:hypothetical protein
LADRLVVELDAELRHAIGVGNAPLIGLVAKPAGISGSVRSRP